jgi:hypothetical protein
MKGREREKKKKGKSEESRQGDVRGGNVKNRDKN